jgi:hypothetical protein
LSGSSKHRKAFAIRVVDLELPKLSVDVLRQYSLPNTVLRRSTSRVFRFEVSISTPRLDLGSKSQQILTLARARSIWDVQPLGAKTRVTPVDFSSTLNVKPAR